MALTAQQIIALALQDAKAPGWTAQAGQLLNAILSELCETYDWEASKFTFTGTLNPSVTAANPNLVQGQGPTALPPTYLRMVPKTFQWWFSGVPYPLVNTDDAEFDNQVQQTGIASLARNYITDLSDPGSPVFFIYPPTNGAYPYQGRCHVRMPDIGSNTTAPTGWVSGANPPETSAVVPWFPNTTYLRARVSGEVMRMTGDARWERVLGKNGNGTGAQDILDRILEMADDKQSRSQRVQLDRRRFGGASAYSRLPDTKNIFG